MACSPGLAGIMQVNLPPPPAFVKQASYDWAMLQRDYPDQVCSIARALEVIGERWTLLILRDALVGLTRFEEFQAKLGIASNVLTNRLKRLCDEELLERIPDPERPGRPKYLLTDKGRELAPALIVLMKWGDRHYPTPGGPPRLRRQHRPRPPLRPMRQTRGARGDRAPARPRGASRRARPGVSRPRGPGPATCNLPPVLRRSQPGTLAPSRVVGAGPESARHRIARTRWLRVVGLLAGGPRTWQSQYLTTTPASRHTCSSTELARRSTSIARCWARESGSACPAPTAGFFMPSLSLAIR